MSTAAAFADYLAIPAVNWSTLKEMRRSPLQYRHRLNTPREDTTTLAMGRAVHTAVFEPDRFALEYAVFKGPRRAGKKWDEFRAAHVGDTILKREEYERAISIRDAVRSNKFAARYLARGKAEQHIRWTDRETGLECKARLDFVSESSPALVDLKTTATIAHSRFTSTAYNLGYHCQMGMYRWGLQEVLGRELPVVIVAVESAAPHDVAVFEYDGDCLSSGLDEVRSLLTKLDYHRETDTWPGMYAEPQYLEFPAWVTQREDENVSDLGLED